MDSSNLHSFEDTQPLSLGGTAVTRTLAETAHRIDAIGHTLCELTKGDLAALLVLVRLDRARMLAERWQYVKARGAEKTRFAELLRTLDIQIDAQNKLADKLARMHTLAP